MIHMLELKRSTLDGAAESENEEILLATAALAIGDKQPALGTIVG